MNLDAQDILVASAIGAICGVVDSVFVGTANDGRGPDGNESILGSVSDAAYEKLVVGAARLNGWNGNGGLKGAIGKLEGLAKVPYDHQTSKRTGDVVSHLSASNHHFRQPGHSPDLIGLVTAVRDGLDGKATFFDQGHVVRIDAEPLFEGDPLPLRVLKISGLWFVHLLSDVAGSSSGGGRGMGLPVPLLNALQKYDFTDLDLSALNEALEKVYESGYDVRFATATAVPVLIEEALARAYWVVREHCVNERPLEECVKEATNPRATPSDLDWLLLIANGTLCAFDLADAAIRNKDAVTVVCRMNYAAWLRLAMLSVGMISGESKEELEKALSILGAVALDLLDAHEEAKVDAYRQRMQSLIIQCKDWTYEASDLLESEARRIQQLSESVASNELSSVDRATMSVELAEASGAEVIANLDELDDFMA